MYILCMYVYVAYKDELLPRLCNGKVAVDAKPDFVFPVKLPQSFWIKFEFIKPSFDSGLCVGIVEQGDST